MKYRPVYKNLDTAFVDLAALLDYLRARRFTGFVRFSANGAAADIYLTADKKLKVRADGDFAGQNEDAAGLLRRVLSRSREPGGIIDVFQSAAQSENPAAGNHSSEIRETPAPRAGPSKENFETLLDLMGELLGTIDRALAAAGLGFRAAFRKAGREIAADYPFLKTLDYAEGKISLGDAMPRPALFVAGVLEAVRRIFGKLGANPKFAEVHRRATQKIIILLHRRRAFYDEFRITAPLEKILGA